MPIIILLLIYNAQAIGQNKASISGHITDSLTGKPLGFSTVAIVNSGDTSLLSYAVAKDDGIFHLSRLPKNRLLSLVVSHIGYKSYRKEIILSPGNNYMGMLKLQGESLNEVVIRGYQSPIVVKGDTTEFLAEGFKTRPNALLEELLRLLPGAQVTENGEVIINGQGTSRILIDGREFFGSNQIIALKNLEAALIDKVHVYLDRESDPDRKSNENNLKYIVNLKLKSSAKKSTIGRFLAGVGSRDRYEASGILSSFRDTLQFSFMAAANNLNSTGFNKSELQSMGGFNRSGTDQIDQTNVAGRQNGGIARLASTGLNINNDYGNKLKLNLAYFLANSIHHNSTRNLNEQLLGSSTITSLRNDKSTRRSTSHSIGGLIEWKPDTSIIIRYRPSINFSPGKYHHFSFLSQSNTEVDKLSETTGTIKNASFNDSFSHNLNYYKKFNRGRSITINNVMSINEGGTEAYNFNRLEPFSNGIPSSLFDRYVKSETKTNWSGLSLLYNLPLTKEFTLELYSNTRFYRWAEPVSTFDLNSSTNKYDEFLPNQSNDFVRTGFFQNIKPLLNYQMTSNLRLRVGIDLEIQDVDNKYNSYVKDIRQKFAVWFPSLIVDYKTYSLAYQEWIELPSIQYMQPVKREVSSQYIFIGNPELRAVRVRNLKSNIYKHITSRMLSLNGYMNATFYDDSFVQRATIDEKGFATSSIVNAGSSFSVNGGVGFSKQYRKSQRLLIGISTGMNLASQNSIIYLNSSRARQNTSSVALSQDLSFNYNSSAIVNFQYRYNRLATNYDNNAFDQMTAFTHNLGMSGMFRLPKRIVFESTYSYRYNPQIAKGFPRGSHIFNVALSLLTFKSDRGQVKLSVYDLLNQNISVSRYGNLNATITNEQTILKRYAILNFLFRFNSMKSK